MDRQKPIESKVITIESYVFPEEERIGHHEHITGLVADYRCSRLVSSSRILSTEKLEVGYTFESYGRDGDFSRSEAFSFIVADKDYKKLQIVSLTPPFDIPNPLAIRQLRDQLPKKLVKLLPK